MISYAADNCLAFEHAHNAITHANCITPSQIFDISYNTGWITTKLYSLFTIVTVISDIPHSLANVSGFNLRICFRAADLTPTGSPVHYALYHTKSQVIFYWHLTIFFFSFHVFTYLKVELINILVLFSLYILNIKYNIYIKYMFSRVHGICF